MKRSRSLGGRVKPDHGEGVQFDASLTKFQNLIRADYLPEQFS